MHSLAVTFLPLPVSKLLIITDFKTIEEGVAAAKAKNADIVVICSSDDEYAELAPQAAEKLDNEILVVAGNPACKAELEEKGITNFIHVKSNVLEELKDVSSTLNIE